MEYDRPLSKVCDAADFFRQDYIDTVTKELNETPALRRKQWEFAMILQALKKQDLLKANNVGLSMGSGNETVLYAIARHVKHLTVTDLYNTESSWECAQASHPDEYIRKSKPFPVDDAKLSAFNMDMRSLAFEDDSFDFAYSSCAFEHIGDDEDFLQHLHEVHRVLKDHGVYVMTTEFTFADKTIPIRNNFLFSADHLDRLFAKSKFTPESKFDARLTKQSANFPIPGQVDDLFYQGESHFAKALVSSCIVPHVQLLYGKQPFTSCIFVLRKTINGRSKSAITFDGLEDSRAFMQSCVNEYRTMIMSDLSLHPFAFLQGRRSPYYAPHHDGETSAHQERSTTLFHTNYYWFGTGIRRIVISLAHQDQVTKSSCVAELRVHRFRTEDPSVVDCAYNSSVSIAPGQLVQTEFALAAEEEYLYAILAVMQTGSCLFSNIRVEVSPFEKTVRTQTIVSPPLLPRTKLVLQVVRASVKAWSPEWAKRIYRRARSYMVL
jgi:SAM-dependent methyltransferase